MKQERLCGHVCCINTTSSGNTWGGGDVMALLLDRRGDDIKITEVVVKVCASHVSRKSLIC